MTLPLDLAWQRSRQACAWLRGELDDLYAYPPRLDHLDAAVAARRSSPQAPRDELVAALRASLEPFGVDLAQAAALDELARPDAVAVLTGQQPGVFGGPLYTLLKAVGAVALTERLRAAGRPAVTIFWSATEDDDFAEVRSLGLVGRDGGSRTIRVEADGDDETPVGRRRLLDDPRAELAAMLPDTVWREWVIDDLCAGYAPGGTLGDGFARLISRLLGGRGLLLADPLSPALRRLSAPIFARALEQPEEGTRHANAIGAALRARGFAVPMHRQADLCPFFVIDGGRRCRVRVEDGGFRLETGQRLDAAALARRIAADPDCCSASLLLRPVIQDFLFPTAAFCVGPGEIAYLAQVAPMYELLGIAPPLLLPRFSATILEPKPAKHLAAYNLSLADCWQPLEQLGGAVSRRRNGAGTEAVFAVAGQAVEAAVQPLLAHAVEVDNSLGRSGQTRLHRIRAELGKLEAKVQKSLRRQDAELHRRLSHIYTHAAPAGGLQERALGAVHLLAGYGPELVDRLLAAAGETAVDQHAVVEVGP